MQANPQRPKGVWGEDASGAVKIEDIGCQIVINFTPLLVDE
jgi:hypothetical protein